MDNADESKQQLMKRILDSIYIDPEEEKKYAETLLSLGKEQHDTYSIAFAHTYLADYYNRCRNQAPCIYHLHEALAICEEYHYQDLLLLLYILAGNYHASHFDEVSAVQNYLNAYNIAIENNDVRQQMVILNNLSTVFAQKDDKEEALSYSKRAFTIMQELDDDLHHEEYLVLVNLIQLLIDHQNYDKALDIYKLYEERMVHQMSGQHLIDMVLFCQILLAHGMQQRDIAIDKIEQFIEVKVSHPSYSTMYFSFLLDIFDILLMLKEQALCEKSLVQLKKLCHKEDIERQLKLNLCRIQYAREFHLDDLLIPFYQQFYTLQNSVNTIMNKTKASSMREKVMVSHLMKEKDQILMEKKQLEAQVKIDELTRLFNRSYFNKLLNLMRLNRDVKMLSFILIDIDHFKEYNDYYGHYQGDELLKRIARCLDENGDSRIFAARYGGDEFICLCVNTDVAAIEEYLDQVFVSLEQAHIEHKANKVSDIATISCGYAIFPNDDSFIYKDALMLTDAALYCAKANGKNQYRHL